MNFIKSVSFLVIALSVGVSGYLTWIAVRLPLPGDVADPGAPWPIPIQWTKNESQKSLDPLTFRFTSVLENCDVIDEAIKRYKKLIHLSDKGQRDASLPELKEMRINVTNGSCGPEIYPSFRENNDDEFYNLVISSSETVFLDSISIWGALRVKTMSCLSLKKKRQSSLNHQLRVLNAEYVINETSIYDAPRYPHRGLMIDTARHYYPLSTIFKILDAMSWDKLNVFHWHIVDDQAFPYVSKTFPNMSQLGAYSPYHIYSQENVSAVIREARLRGIRVIPEFDTPGHTWSWGKSFPDLITPCWGNGTEGGPHVPNYPMHGSDEIVNPMLESTYTFLQAIYEEISQVFPDRYVHLGMDEAYHACWESSPDIKSFMEEHGMNRTSEVEQYYAQRLIEIVRNLTTPTNYVIWQDPIENNVTVDSATVVQIWKDYYMGKPPFQPWQEYAQLVASKGYHMILSGPWYLNYVDYGPDWKKVYESDPDNFTDDATLQALMRGGEACSWSEYIDAANVMSLLWPRLSAVAEKLWSNKSLTMDTESAKYRLDQHRCRFIRRGVPAKPILNGYCGDYEWEIDQKQEPDEGEITNEASYSFHHNLYIVFVVILLSFI